jgi:UDP-GlcNAc:undecaprenyl-phosphate GlcNAc-1-phosphate transferase
MGSNIFHSPYFTGIVAFIMSLLLTPVVIKLAYARKWIVAPRQDRWHKKPTALMGGIGIFASFLIAFFASAPTHIDWLLLASCTVMFVTGLVDDLVELQPIIKLLVQVICAFLLIYDRYTFGNDLFSWGGIPLTFFWVIGITNAMNLLDNMDGLAAGLSCIISAIAGVLAVNSGEYGLASFAFAITGSTFGFCFYNFNPAKIFMGDSGSLFLGFSLSFLSLALQKHFTGAGSPLLMVFIPVALLAIPIMDTTLVTVKRLFAGRKVSQGGKDHTSHRLVALGLSERKAVLYLYGISLLWGILCLFIKSIDGDVFLVLVLLLSLFSIVFALILSGVKVYNESEEKLIYLRSRGQGMKNNLLIRFIFLNKKMILGIFADILIIYASFFLAAKATGVKLAGEYSILAFFICVKILLFYLYNLYNRMWRYISMKELSGYIVSLFFSTVVIVIALYLSNNYYLYNGYFFLTDFQLSFTGIIFSRLLYRWLKEFFYVSKLKNKRALIYGAGDRGYLLIKELMQNDKYDILAVGCIDDDPAKQNMHMHGLKIFGGAEAIEEACARVNASYVIIATLAISEEKEAALRQQLLRSKIKVGRFSINLALGENM